MKLTLSDKISLIYSSAETQRNVAALIGVSHQKVGRLLRVGEPGGYPLNSRVFSDPELIAAVNVAFDIHKDLTRDKARDDDLPYSPAVPIYSARMLMSDGVRGDRVEATNLHWVRDAVRDEWLRAIHRSGKYAQISVGSVVSMVDYNRMAQRFTDAARHKRNPDKMRNARTFLINTINRAIEQTGNDKLFTIIPARHFERDADGVLTLNLESISSPDLAAIFQKLDRLDLPSIIGRVQTPYIPITQGFDVENTIHTVNARLNEKHAGAIGEPGTRMADRILLQVDTRNGKDQKFRDKHARPTKPRKARRGTKRNQRSAGGNRKR